MPGLITRGARSARGYGFGYKAATVQATFTWNPSATNASITLSNGNLTASITSSSAYTITLGTVSRTTGKWYFEIKADVVGGVPAEYGFGIAPSTQGTSEWLGQSGTNSIGFYADGSKYVGGPPSSSASFVSGDVISIAYDADTGKVWLAVNGTFSGDPAAGTGQAGTLTTGSAMCPGGEPYDTSSFTINTTFSYSPPSGFSPW